MNSGKIKTLLDAFGTFLFLLFLLPIFGFVPYLMINSENQIYPFEIGVFRFVGAVPLFIGVLTLLWSAGSLAFSGKGTPAHFYPPEVFVATGLYRYVRNPMFVSGISILIGMALLFESTKVFIYALGLFVFFNLLILFEEGTLKESFGESYVQYCKFVPRWIPRLRPFRGDLSNEHL